MTDKCTTDKPKQARRCVACGETVSKRQLMRVVRTPEGTVKYDPTGHANGRGAYLCAKDCCIEKAQKKKLFSVSLKAEADDELYCELKKAAAGNDGK